jgi:type IV pilus assembly protein PilB
VRKGDQKKAGLGGSLSDLYTPEAGGSSNDDDLGARLVEAGVVSSEMLANAQRVLKQTPGKHLAEILSDMGVHESDLQPLVAEQARLPFERVDASNIRNFDAKAVHRLGPKYCMNNLVLPLRREGSRYVVGTVSPHDVFVLDDVKRQLGAPTIKQVLVTAGDIKAVIDTLTDGESEDYDVEEMLVDVDEDDVEVMKEELSDADAKDAESSPVVRLVNHIIQSALKEGASDIHIEPDEKDLKVRLRIDGVLFDLMNPPKKMHAAMTSRIKIMSNLDIAERRLPQDGRIRATVLGRKLDLRVSTLPTSHGEKTVMRILDNRSISVPLEELGFAEETLLIWRNQIAQPHGIILVTGPTGSGKTTTLYSSIQCMDFRRLNISTVEDPVEYNLSGITQVQTHERIGLNFSATLRSLLRQDPDVILVGEIRDTETATIAIQPALTGHLVLSTLHTNDAPSSITRMINIGMEPFLVGAAVRSVLAQRLVRRICPKCAEKSKLDSDVAEIMVAHGITVSKIMQGKGCARCRETGYAGRIGLYEMLLLDDFLRDSVARNPNVTEFRRTCTERGMVTLREDGFKKIADGTTTVEEVLRVTEATI